MLRFGKGEGANKREEERVIRKGRKSSKVSVGVEKTQRAKSFRKEGLVTCCWAPDSNKWFRMNMENEHHLPKDEFCQ